MACRVWRRAGSDEGGYCRALPGLFTQGHSRRAPFTASGKAVGSFLITSWLPEHPASHNATSLAHKFGCLLSTR